MAKQSIQVEERFHTTRLDKLLTNLNPEESRSQIQSWIKEGFVQVNGKKAKTNYRCQQGDFIEGEIPEEEAFELRPESMDLDIRYEDEHLLVVNKPKGMVVHPAAGHSNGTLVNGLIAYTNLSDINGEFRPGIVHRLDKDTSGLMVVAKTNDTHEKLATMLKERTVKRQYQAIVHGEIEHELGTIEAPISRDPNDRKRMAVVDHGKEAITHFRVHERFPNYTHVVCDLETGRTHQIRVHFKYIGFPIVGDPKYGPRKTLNSEGQALHARRLEFTHPITMENIIVTAEAPAIFQETLKEINRWT